MSGAAAPIASLDEVYREGRYLPGSAEAMQWAMDVSVAPQEQNPPCVDVAGDPRRKQFLVAVLAAMDAARLDAIIYPSWSNPPSPASSKSPESSITRSLHTAGTSRKLAPICPFPVFVAPV